MTVGLARLLAPKSVAVIGASSAPEKPGYQMLRAFENFPGSVYAVNPRGGEILGRPVYSSISAIPDTVDLIAMVVPPNASADVLREAADCNVGAAFMVSGGFSETGGDGYKRQAEVLDICRKGGIRLLGPNTSGFMCPDRKLFCTFLPAATKLRKGSIGIVAQSGGINITLAFLAHEMGLGISLSIGIGNGADVGVTDVIRHLADDEGTDVIAVHLEGIADGRNLCETIRQTVTKKPVVALPVGKADLGGFAESHTGKMMGAFDLTCAALSQAGAVVVHSTGELIDAADAFSRFRLPPKADPGVGILTGQAGPGLLMTDRLRSAGISVPTISKKSQADIAAMLPPLTYIKNPVDTGRPLENFGDVCVSLANDDAIDAVLVYALYEADSVDFGAAIGAGIGASGKPFIFGTQGVKSDIGPLVKSVRSAGAVGITSPDRVANAMRALVEDAKVQYRLGLPPQTEPEIPDAKLSAKPDEANVKDFIESWGIRTPRRLRCNSHDEAQLANRRISGPVAVKILDANILHKSDVGGIRLDVRTGKQLEAALEAIDAIKSSTRKKKYLVEEMAPPGLEIIIGARKDPSWGPVVLLGLGGVAAEAMNDTSIRLAPVNRNEARSMIDDLQASALFGPYRSAAPRDREALADVILAMSSIILETAGLREIELNPVRVYAEGDGVIALDAVVLR